MKPVVGAFKSRSAAQRAADKLVPLGIPKDRISILTLDVTQTELAQVPIQGAPSNLAWARSWAQPLAELLA
jgi:hypothetical protein